MLEAVDLGTPSNSNGIYIDEKKNSVERPDKLSLFR
jgi:hypothetical protein